MIYEYPAAHWKLVRSPTRNASAHYLVTAAPRLLSALEEVFKEINAGGTVQRGDTTYYSIASAVGSAYDCETMNSTCDRCGRADATTIMSKFNFDNLCLTCKDKETKHPKYEEASAAELDAVLAGVTNFPGVGKPEDL